MARFAGWHDKKKVADSMHLYSYQFDKAFLKLKKAGIVSESEGRCRLTVEPQELSVYDVIKAVEGEIHINRCLEEDRFCSRDAADICVIRDMYEKLQSDIITTLKRKTLSSLLEDESKKCLL